MDLISFLAACDSGISAGTGNCAKCSESCLSCQTGVCRTCKKSLGFLLFSFVAVKNGLSWEIGRVERYSYTFFSTTIWLAHRNLTAYILSITASFLVQDFSLSDNWNRYSISNVLRKRILFYEYFHFQWNENGFELLFL